MLRPESRNNQMLQGVHRGLSLHQACIFSTGAPGARALHARDLAGLFDIAIGEQVEQVFFCRLFIVVSLVHEIVDDMTHIRRHPVFLPVAAHEFENLPVVIRQFEMLLGCQFLRDVPVSDLGIDDIALDVACKLQCIQHFRCSC